MKVSEIQKLLKNANAGEIEAIEASLKSDERIGVKNSLAKAKARLKAEADEEMRLARMYEYEGSLKESRGSKVAIGLDEVGRGPLAGPVTVGAVVLDLSVSIPKLNDSKQLSEPSRRSIAEDIKRKCIACDVVHIDAPQIDKIGIANALREAFKKAIEAIEDKGIVADLILLDGNPMHLDEREINIVKGDSKCPSIAAASVIAKVERDALMADLSKDYPQYGFEINKGYGTQAHRDAIRECGLSDLHRRSFCSEFLQKSLF